MRSCCMTAPGRRMTIDVLEVQRRRVKSAGVGPESKKGVVECAGSKSEPTVVDECTRGPAGFGPSAKKCHIPESSQCHW
jgi:hypothetical protein